MDAVTSSGSVGLAVWARWVLGAWVSDGMIGGGVLTWSYLLPSSRESILGLVRGSKWIPA